MQKRRIVFAGSCWPVNMGNAFVNLGAIHSLKIAAGSQDNIFHVGGMSNYLFGERKKLEHSLAFAEYIDCEYMINAGMTMCYEHLVAGLPVYQQCAKRGIKIIFLGGGAHYYTNEEVKIVREAMKEFPIYGLVSRDTYTYEQYGDLAQHSYDGIDSALFISDCFQPLPLSVPDFDVMAFDSLKEPHIDHEGRLVIRTHHDCWPPLFKPDYFSFPRTVISDLPSDYLSLYAHATTTYSDRVHACLPALAFGRQARMYFTEDDKRIHMFQRLGIPEIYKQPVSLDVVWLAEEKNRQVRFIRSILSDTSREKPSGETRTAISPLATTRTPECCLFLFVSDTKITLSRTIDSILSQSLLHFNLYIVDFTDNHAVQKEVRNYEDARLQYIAKDIDISFKDIFEEEAGGKYITCVSAEVTYTPHFLYELKHFLDQNLEVDLVYADYRQLAWGGTVTQVNARHVFERQQNVGYCFLVREKAMTPEPAQKIGIFQRNTLHIPINKTAVFSHFSEAMGNRYYAPGFYNTGMRIWYRIQEMSKHEGWLMTVKKSSFFLKRKVKKEKKQSEA